MRTKVSGGTRTRKTYVALLVVGVLAMAPWAATHALFSDSASVGANAFSTGSVDVAASPASAAVSLSGMAPGDGVTAPVTVSNGGTLEMRYAMTTSTTGSAALASGLEMEIRSGVTTCSTAGFGASGTSIYNSTLASGALGNPAQGAQAGDRALSAGGSETLCFQVRLPSTAANSLQSLATTATFTFDAEQTANNA